MLVRNLRSLLRGLMQPAFLRQWFSTPDLSREPSPSQRTPYQRSHALIQTERHQLPFVFPADQRVVHLVSNVARPPITVRDVQRFHQGPPGELGARVLPPFTSPT